MGAAWVSWTFRLGGGENRFGNRYSETVVGLSRVFAIRFGGLFPGIGLVDDEEGRRPFTEAAKRPPVLDQEGPLGIVLREKIIMRMSARSTGMSIPSEASLSTISKYFFWVLC